MSQPQAFTSLMRERMVLQQQAVTPGSLLSRRASALHLFRAGRHGMHVQLVAACDAVYLGNGVVGAQGPPLGQLPGLFPAGNNMIRRRSASAGSRRRCTVYHAALLQRLYAQLCCHARNAGFLPNL